MNINAIYEVMLEGRVIKVDRDTWDLIRKYVRENTWFYVMYCGKRYKYSKDRTYYDRPTRFDFELSKPWDDDTPKIIYLD